MLDVAGVGESGWVFTLFRTGRQPSSATVEAHRAAFRDAVDRLGLTLVEITPAATADEVLVPVAEPADQPRSALGAHWALPGELDRVWVHIGLRQDAPREVKEVKLRELMRTPAWSAAPGDVQRQADVFLADD
ncbi:hypothetical protein [Streptomyces lavendulocolor]|uniref:hypothetical protein n=1 Tax=Streptomyces lavendulocolor TaxID=67316 RepID=UPI003C2CDAFF